MRRPSVSAILFFLCTLAGSLVTWSGWAAATPLLALKEAENCQGCHKPGRSQRPVLERRCTLDCQGCHVDPAGAGPRNQWGYYYTQAESNALHFYQPQDPLDDESRFDLHYDGRVMRRYFEGDSRTFPMSSELSVRARPFIEYLHLTYQALYMGRIGDQSFRSARDDDRRYREKFSLMLDALPMNTYVRAYRGPPMYGLRRPNHSLWIRERIGLDQFATTDAIEVGGTPNVPFLRWSKMLGDPYAEPEERQKGTSFHGGFRGVTLAWHFNVSTWDTQSDTADIKMRALGGGLKPWKFIFMAERNWRSVTWKDDRAPQLAFATRAPRLHPSSEIDEITAAFAGIPGVILGYVQEELHDDQSASLRRSGFLDLHPMPFLQLELWRRFESGTRSLADSLALLHAYVDF